MKHEKRYSKTRTVPAQRSNTPQRKDTSWEKVAEWYDELVEEGKDTYQQKVILPNVLRLVGDVKGKAVLDLACGQGFFSRALANAGANVTGADLSESLIRLAKDRSEKNMTYEVANAEHLSFARDQSFDKVLCVLALQNMPDLVPVAKEVRRVLKNDGQFIFVINHPAFRIPKHSSWEHDRANGTIARRIDKYLSKEKIRIDMTPGSQQDKIETWSFHRPLQDYVKALHAAGFAITRLEEWISHKKSQPGPHAQAEDVSRKEFPLFMAVESRPL